MLLRREAQSCAAQVQNNIDSKAIAVTPAAKIDQSPTSNPSNRALAYISLSHLQPSNGSLNSTNVPVLLLPRSNGRHKDCVETGAIFAAIAPALRSDGGCGGCESNAGLRNSRLSATRPSPQGAAAAGRMPVAMALPRGCCPQGRLPRKPFKDTCCPYRGRFQRSLNERYRRPVEIGTSNVSLPGEDADVLPERFLLDHGAEPVGDFVADNIER